MHRIIRSIALLGVMSIAAAPAAAQQFEILHAFAAPADGVTPIQPYAPSAPPIDGPDGAMYGTTVAGGVFDRGTVYRLTASGLTVVHHFFGLDGAHPIGTLRLGPDGLLYGTTYDGGVQNRGTVFRMSPAGAFQTLHSFTAAEGRNPTAGLIRGTDGNYWGTTLRGGSADTGTVFKISPTGAFTQMHSFVFELFTENTMVYPYAGLIQAQDGNFYGTTYGYTGVFGGTVFRMTPAGTVTRLHVFSGSIGVGGTVEGPKIYAGLVEGSDGQMYGGACCGGGGGFMSEADRPQIFRIGTDSFATLREMSGVFSALTEGADHAFYGATMDGLLFRIESNGSFAEIKTLTDVEGVFPSGVRTGGDWIIGSAYGGGPAGGGVIFRFKRE
jgi:uncharacterized repeat protein (TIGR03803 family)